jgi:prepilin-type N-terminal cleavage/methylation domain-containing protein
MIRSHSHSLRAAALGHGAGRASRRAFTLVELLVVIAIIALLVALVTAGVMQVLSRGPDAGDLAEIKKLEMAIGKFYARHTAYPPDYVKLCHFETDYNPANPLDMASRQILERIWPGIFKYSYSANDPVRNTPVPWAGYDRNTWKPIQLPQHPSAQTSAGTPQNCVILQGDQCLVFFLGGPQGIFGFCESKVSYDPANKVALSPIDPWDHPKFTGNVGKIQDYEFPNSRLQPRKTSNPNPNLVEPFMPVDQFPSYLDNWEKKEIVYFVGGNKKTYNEFLHWNKLPKFSHGIVDLNVEPYYALAANGITRKYHNPNTFQIIVAGKDNIFGGPGPWNNGVSPVLNEFWKDNRANFHTEQLGTAQ